MKAKLLTIGKAAKLMNVTVKALRFYDRIGLLKPGYIDPQTNYRYYTLDQLMSLDLIKAARNLEISPNALVPYFAKKDTEQLVGLLRSHKELLADRMKQLAKTLEQIDTIERMLRISEDADRSRDIYIREIPDRFVVTQPFPMAEGESEILMSFYQLIASLHRLGLTYLYEDGVIYSLDKDTMRPESIYASVIEEPSSNDCRLLPGGKYLCTIMQRENAEEQYNKLWEYAISHGLQPEYIIQTELLTDFFADGPKYVEAQIKADLLA